MTSIPNPDGLAFTEPTAGFTPVEPVETTSEPQSDFSRVIDQLNAFLRGEISAAETYRMALEKLGASESFPKTSLQTLVKIQEEHGRAAQTLRNRIRELGGIAAESSGIWGTWAKLAHGSASLFGETAALKSLREGEEHGFNDYKAGLVNLDSVSADLVRGQMLANQDLHLNTLDELIKNQGS